MNTSRWWGVASVMAISGMGSAVSAAPWGQDGYASIGGFNMPEKSSSGFEFNYIEEVNDVLALRGGVAFYSSVKYKDGVTYSVTGVTGAAYYHFDIDYVNPYIGLGAFAGAPSNCKQSIEFEEDECESNGVLSLYPELGIAVHLDRVLFYPYVRRNFSTNNNGEAANSIGFSIGLNF